MYLCVCVRVCISVATVLSNMIGWIISKTSVYSNFIQLFQNIYYTYEGMCAIQPTRWLYLQNDSIWVESFVFIRFLISLVSFRAWLCTVTQAPLVWYVDSTFCLLCVWDCTSLLWSVLFVYKPVQRFFSRAVQKHQAQTCSHVFTSRVKPDNMQVKSAMYILASIAIIIF